MKLESFCSYKERFIAALQKEQNLTAHTIRAYESDVRQFIEFWEKVETQEQRMCTIHAIAERFFKMLQHKKSNVASIARKVSCLRSYERFIAHTAQISLQLNLVRPTVAKKVPHCLSLDDVFYLLDTLPAEKMETAFPARDKAIFELLYATGILCSELVTVRIKDIDFVKKTITIHNASKKERVVVFGSACEQKLLHYISKERATIKHHAECLFLNYRHEPLTTRSVQRIIGAFSSYLDKKCRITPHTLRHSYAAHMVHKGADLATLKELLGHRSIGTTAKYSRIAPEPLLPKKEFERINEL